MLDLWALRVLVEVADRGSFSAAAEALAMTQPAVSRQIAGLERRLRLRLFQRVARGVRPTSAGEVAIALARDALAGVQTMEARLGALVALSGGTLRMSAFPSVNTAFVPEAIRRFREAHPGVRVTLLRADAEGGVSAVRAGRVDLALLTEWDLYADPDAARVAAVDSEPERIPTDGVELVPLLDEELLVALPVDHPLAGRRRVALRALRDEAWIDGAHPDCLGPLAPLVDALGGPPRVEFFCDDWNGKQALVAAGAGVMVVPTLARQAMRADLVLLPPDPPLPTRRLVAVAAVAPHRAPAVTAMLPVLTTLAGHHRTPAVAR